MSSEESLSSRHQSFILSLCMYLMARTYSWWYSSLHLIVMMMSVKDLMMIIIIIRGRQVLWTSNCWEHAFSCLRRNNIPSVARNSLPETSPSSSFPVESLIIFGIMSSHYERDLPHSFKLSLSNYFLAMIIIWVHCFRGYMSNHFFEIERRQHGLSSL